MKKIASTLLLALLCCLPARAQDLALIFESEPGERPGFFDIQTIEESFFLLDANGDGTPDLILTRDDDDGNLQDLRVISGATGVDTLINVVLWEVQDVPMTLFGDLRERDGMKIFGFVDADGDGTREALFANDQGVVLVNPSNNILSWNHGFSQPTSPVRLRAVIDLTGDGFPELILVLPETRQVQVWSRAP